MRKIANYLLVALLLAMLLAGCETAETSPNPSPRLVTTGATASTTISPATTVVGTRTANPFFTPEPTVLLPTPLPTFKLEFEFKPGQPLLEAVFVTNRPLGGDNDWQLKLEADGVAKFTLYPRDKNRATTQERYLSPERQRKLLEELDRLGVLTVPDTAPPPTNTPMVITRNLLLYLKDKPKFISNLSSRTDDSLAEMLKLIRTTIENAPLRNAP